MWMARQVLRRAQALPSQETRSWYCIESRCLMWGIRSIIPKSLQPQILQALYDNHPGITRMKAIARSYVWWSGLDKDIENQAKVCIQLSVKPAVALSHFTSSMGLAYNTLEVNTYRFRQDVPYTCRCTL